MVKGLGHSLILEYLIALLFSIFSNQAMCQPQDWADFVSDKQAVAYILEFDSANSLMGPHKGMFNIGHDIPLLRKGEVYNINIIVSDVHLFDSIPIVQIRPSNDKTAQGKRIVVQDYDWLTQGTYYLNPIVHEGQLNLTLNYEAKGNENLINVGFQDGYDVFAPWVNGVELDLYNQSYYWVNAIIVWSDRSKWILVSGETRSRWKRRKTFIKQFESIPKVYLKPLPKLSDRNPKLDENRVINPHVEKE